VYSSVPHVNRGDTPESGRIHMKVGIQCILFSVGFPNQIFIFSSENKSILKKKEHIYCTESIPLHFVIDQQNLILDNLNINEKHWIYILRLKLNTFLKKLLIQMTSKVNIKKRFFLHIWISFRTNFKKSASRHFKGNFEFCEKFWEKGGTFCIASININSNEVLYS